MEQLEARQLLAVNVLGPLGTYQSWEDAEDLVFDLREVFSTDQDQSLRYELVGNTNPGIVDATVEQWSLRVRHREDQYGESDVTVKAVGAQDGQYAVDTLQLRVRGVNDFPRLIKGMPATAVPEGGQLTLDLTEYFSDVEQLAHELVYSLTPLDASFPGDPVRSAEVTNGWLQLDLTADTFGYGKYTVRARDAEGGTVATTWLLYVDPVNDAPVAQPMPDRFHRVTFGGTSPVVALDLWEQHIYDRTGRPYFWDAEDGAYLSFSVAVDRPDVFAVAPHVDEHGFLLYQPTSVPEFHRSAVVTLTARDREGVVALCLDGTLPAFTVRVDNRSVLLGGLAGVDPSASSPGMPGSDPPSTGGTTGGVSLPGNPLPPPPPQPPAPIQPFFDLTVLEPVVEQSRQHQPGVFVALNDDYGEQNLALDTILVGPHDRAVSVLRWAKDNEPDRIPEQGRVHRIDRQWARPGDDWSDDAGLHGSGRDVRIARVQSNTCGTVVFEYPEVTKVWVPAWVLYGTAAFAHNSSFWQVGARWIEVEAERAYRMQGTNQLSGDADGGMVFPLAIEGMSLGSGQIVATFTPAGAAGTLLDSVTVHVVNVDLDIDSDNDQGLRLPDRSPREEMLEEDASEPGKRIPVNSRDADRDGIPDFLDGFALDDYVGSPFGPNADDDRVTAEHGVGFVPLVIELSAPIDPERAQLRFSYSGSDPAAATIGADNSRHVAPGGLRLWTVDEWQARSPRSANDPISPGQYVVPFMPYLGGNTSDSQARATYTVAQLTGGQVARQFTLFVEGIQAGQHTIQVMVDPEGTAKSAVGATGSAGAITDPGLFAGFTLVDRVKVLVESRVTVTAVDAYGAETAPEQSDDRVVFYVSRDADDQATPLWVYYRLLGNQPDIQPATDPVVNPARADYTVVHYGGYPAGLVADPETLVGAVMIPAGVSGVSIVVRSVNDRTVEWDETIALELITWDDYWAMVDQSDHATPLANALGTPVTLRSWANQSVYRLMWDEAGQPLGQRATATLLDDDRLEGTAISRPDFDTTELTTHQIGYGPVFTDVHAGHAQIAIPVWSPTYREDDNLVPIVEVVLQLPVMEEPVTRLAGSLRVAGIEAQELEFESGELPDYLRTHPYADLRLVLLGSPSLASRLPSGYYDYDAIITVHGETMRAQRTVRGGMALFNRVDARWGTREFGERWWLDELDRLVPFDGVTYAYDSPNPQLAERGAAAHSGMLQLGGDNVATRVESRAREPLAMIDVSDSDSSKVQRSNEAQWRGRSAADGREYMVTSAGPNQLSADVTWTFHTVTPQHVYQVYVTWEPGLAMATNAVYQVSGAVPLGRGPGEVYVDQRYIPGEHRWNNRQWRSLGVFVAAENGDPLQVRLGTFDSHGIPVDGPISAGAVMIVDQWDFHTAPDSASRLELDVDNKRFCWTTKQGEVLSFDTTSGLLRARIDRNGNRTEYRYVDATGDGRAEELARVVRQGGRETQLMYAGGTLNRIIDDVGRVTLWSIVGGQTRTVTLPAPGYGQTQPIWRFAYASSDGLLQSVTDPRGQQTSVQRDALARRVARVVNADGKAWSLRPYLLDGLEGQWRTEATGRLGARDQDGWGRFEPRALMVDTRGNRWHYQTDRYGQLTAASQPPVPGSPRHDVWLWKRDVRGLPLFTLLPAGGGGDTPLPAIMQWQTYDTRGNLVRCTFQDGTYEQWTYDAKFSQVVEYRDALRRSIQYRLDSRGNVVEQVEREWKYADTPDRVTRYTYSSVPAAISRLPGGLRTQQTVAAGTPDAVTTRWEYFPSGSAIGLLRSVQQAVGAADPAVTSVESFEYDASRLLRSKVDPLGRVTRYVYDRLGRLYQQIDPHPGTSDHLAAITTYVHDAGGNLITKTDPQGAITRFTYDAMNRLTSTLLPSPGGHPETDQTSAQQTLRYDGEGNVVVETNALGHRVNHVYDARNQLASTTWPAPGANVAPPGALHGPPVVTFVYDTLGNLRSRTDPRGAVTSYQYDPSQRITRITHPDPGTGQHAARVEQLVYDAVGQLIEKQEGTSDQRLVVQYQYDDLGRLRTETIPHRPGGFFAATQYKYDLRDNLVAVTQPSGTVTHHEYDQRNRLRKTSQPDPDGVGSLGRPVTTWEYNRDDTLRREVFYDSSRPDVRSVTDYEYDQLGRVVRRVAPDPDFAGPLDAPQVRYHYDVAGNVITVLEEWGTHEANVTHYSYDRLNRLWRTARPIAGVGVVEELLVFDRVGNRIREWETMVTVGTAAAYRRTDYSFDALGRMTARIDPASQAGGARPVTRYVHDAAGNVRYEQDAAGNWRQYLTDQLHRLVSVVEPGTADHGSPVTSFEYTAAGLLSAIVDPLGRRTEYQYDDRGNRITQRGPLINGQYPLEQTEYDLAGNPVRVVDSNGNRTHVQYDLLGRPVRIEHNGLVTSRRYDGWGQVVSETDPSGATARFGYDALGRRVTVMPPHPSGGQMMDKAVDDRDAAFQGEWLDRSGGYRGQHRAIDTSLGAGSLATWTVTGLRANSTYAIFATWTPDPSNVQQARFRVLDGADSALVTVVVDQRSMSGEMIADELAWQRLACVTPAGESLQVFLEPLGEGGTLVADAVRVVEMSGTEFRVFDGRGNVIARRNGLGHDRQYEYDGRSLPTTVTDANGNRTRLAYDLLGRLVSVIDPAGNVTGFGYDDRDRVIREVTGGAGEEAVTRYDYDILGNLVSVVDGLGRVRRFQYDPLGRMVQETWYASETDSVVDAARAHTVKWTYDVAGRLVAAQDATSQYVFGHDGLDREVISTAKLSGLPEIVKTSAYSRHDDLPTAKVLALGNQQLLVTQFGYDAQGRVAQLRQSGAHVAEKRVDFSYSPNGSPAVVRRYADLSGTKPVATSHYEYDGQSRLKRLAHRQGSEMLADYQWTFDAGHQVTQVQSLRDGATRFAYDAEGQLVYEGVVGGTYANYAYDGNGNRIMDGYVTGPGNRLLSDGEFDYSYDAVGNRTRRVDIATGEVTEYHWDHANRLTAVIDRAATRGAVLQEVEYLYDPFGRRIGKTITPAHGPSEIERFVFDDQHVALRFVNGQLANRYLHGPSVDQILADEQLGGDAYPGGTLWALTDNLGSVRDLVAYDKADGSVRVVNHREYDAFGNLSGESTSTIDHVFGFAGRELDEETGLSFHRARYYDPRIGQFISEDPLGFAGGDFNTRRYVGNSPTNRVDPTGLYGEDVHFYFTYYTARYLGLNQATSWLNSKEKPISEAYLVAYFATRIDYDATTSPLSDNGVLARSRFHFPDPNDRGGVRADDPRVRMALRAVGTAGDLEMFGVLLHVYQDTFSHRGYGDRVGHARDKYRPDEPSLHAPRAKEMAQRVYLEMENLLLARRGLKRGKDDAKIAELLDGKSFDDLWDRIHGVLLQPHRDQKIAVARERRTTAWQQLIRSDFENAAPTFTERDPQVTNLLSDRFRRVARAVPVWYANGYQHDDYWRDWSPVLHAGKPPWKANAPVPRPGGAK